MTESIDRIEILVEDNASLKELYGSFDRNIRTIEEEMGISIRLKENKLILIGEPERLKASKKLIDNLLGIVRTKGVLTIQDVRHGIDMILSENKQHLEELLDDFVGSNSEGKLIRPKTWGQKRYIDSMRKNDIVFGIGPAGTGKTYLAMAMAATALKNKKVQRIIITRPAVEAGENLGFLPGDMQEKVDPYLRPIYDALFDILGSETYKKYMEKGLIEIAPLAFMRGRTLDNAYIILDEAQNTTNEQMKMLLTRLGYGSKLVITGDITQVDLRKGEESGLKTIQKILKDIAKIDFIYLGKEDIVRHHIVQKIIEAYEKYEEGR